MLHQVWKGLCCLSLWLLFCVPNRGLWWHPITAQSWADEASVWDRVSTGLTTATWTVSGRKYFVHVAPFTPKVSNTPPHHLLPSLNRGIWWDTKIIAACREGKKGKQDLCAVEGESKERGTKKEHDSDADHACSGLTHKRTSPHSSPPSQRAVPSLGQRAVIWLEGGWNELYTTGQYCFKVTAPGARCMCCRTREQDTGKVFRGLPTKLNHWHRFGVFHKQKR